MTANSEFLCGPSIRHPAEIGRLCLEFATSQKRTCGPEREGHLKLIATFTVTCCYGSEIPKKNSPHGVL
jgi:hypothetical protein